MIQHDSHLKVHNDRISEIDNDDHHTVHNNRHTKFDGDDHLIVDGTRHEKIGRAQLLEAGQEVHQKSGSKTVIDAGAEITLKAGGSFVKLDPSGITIVGAQVKFNSGGSPGLGSGQSAMDALLPGHVATERHERIAPLQQDQLMTAALQGAAVVEVCQRLKDGSNDNVHRCALGDECPCR